MISPISITCAIDHLQNQAQHLADQLGARLCNTSDSTENLNLSLTEKRLELQIHSLAQEGCGGSLYVDFVTGASGYRRLHGGNTKEAIARAVGIKPGVRPYIVDATAGLGNDAFVLACLGCRVTLIEQSPILGALLQDGLNRASRIQDLQDIINNRMTLIIGNSTNIIPTLEKRPDTIYLDPMYPDKRKRKKKSALNKKEMRQIRFIVGDNPDENNLLALALASAGNRVVVKRPKDAPFLGQLAPSHQINMKNSRFDVYMTAL